MGISVTAEEHLSVTDGSPPAKPQMDLGSSGPHHNFLLPININVFFCFFFSVLTLSSPPYSLTLHVWHSVGGLGGAGGGGCRRDKRGWDSLAGWPAVCQLCASGMLSGVEKGLLSPTRTHPLSPFTPKTPALRNHADRFC